MRRPYSVAAREPMMALQGFGGTPGCHDNTATGADLGSGEVIPETGERGCREERTIESGKIIQFTPGPVAGGCELPPIVRKLIPVGHHPVGVADIVAHRRVVRLQNKTITVSTPQAGQKGQGQPILGVGAELQRVLIAEKGLQLLTSGRMSDFFSAWASI